MGSPVFIAKKKGMTQVFAETGEAMPATVLELVNSVVASHRTAERDGYSAVQIAYGEAKEKHISKPEQGHLKKNGVEGLYRHLKEFRVADDAALDAFAVGQPIGLDSLAEAGFVDVTGKTIGKGFQGGIRRWGHHRGPMSHGSKNHRLPGSIGAGTTPGRVQKGLHMAGHTGDSRTKMRKLPVLRYDAERGILMVKGSVPGAENAYLEIEVSAS